jgi:two-component system cell cycle response regulator DivK
VSHSDALDGRCSFPPRYRTARDLPTKLDGCCGSRVVHKIPTAGDIACTSSLQPGGDSLENDELARTAIGSGALVLIIEDYQDCCDLYGTYLALMGFRVLTASDGLEGIRLARETHPDVILMDLNLPGIDGYEATRRLKNADATRDIPVVALTAQNLPRAEWLHRAGFESGIAKPVLPEQVGDVVMRVVQQRTL